MIGKLVTTTLTIAMAGFLAACAAIPSAEPQPPSTDAVEAAPAAPPAVTPRAPHLLHPPIAPQITPVGVTGEAPTPLLDAILDDAAARTGLERGALIVVQDQAVLWPDGGLGCPEPGMMYTQAQVSGYHVLIQAGDRLLDYRAGRNNHFRLCEAPPLHLPSGTPAK